MATTQQKDSIYRLINSILLTLITVFGVFSLTLLVNLNKKVSNIITKQEVQNEKNKNFETRLVKVEEIIDKIKNKPIGN